MIYDLCNGGDLEMLILAKGRLSERETKHIVLQIVEGLWNLYKAHIIHRDIKAANIFINFPDHAELIDMSPD